MSGVKWVTEPSGYLEPNVTEKGFSSIAPITIIDQFTSIVEKYPDKTALCLKRPNADGKIPDEWKTWSWKEYYSDCEKVARPGPSGPFLFIPVSLSFSSLTLTKPLMPLQPLPFASSIPSSPAPSASWTCPSSAS